MPRLAIIGAGITGLSTARSLAAHPAFGAASLCLFDKGRRPGGRLASRETEFGSFDHGVQRALLGEPAAQIHGAGTLRAWPAADSLSESPSWIAEPTMNRLAQAWSQGLDCRCSVTVTGLARDGHQWRLGFDREQDDALFDQVLLTIPTPQAMALLGTAGIENAALSAVRYQPNWTVMWTPSIPLPPNADHWAGTADDPIAWLAREDLKPGRVGPPRLTIQASAAWSIEHLERPADEVAALLIRIAAEVLGLPADAQPIYAAAHRWRYAFVEQRIGTAAFELAPGLYYASDACLGSAVAQAMSAGDAAAKLIIDSASTGPA